MNLSSFFSFVFVLCHIFLFFKILKRGCNSHNPPLYPLIYSICCTCTYVLEPYIYASKIIHHQYSLLDFFLPIICKID